MLLEQEIASTRSGLLADRNIRRLWIEQLCSSAGETLSLIVLPLFVFQMTNSAHSVGLIELLLIFPRVVLAPLTGLVADRFDRRTVMMSADATRLVLVTIIPVTNSFWQLGVIAVLVSIGSAFGRPAELAAIPAVAGPQRLVATLSLVQVSNGIVRIAVPAAGAGIVAAVGPAKAFWLQSLCFIASLIAVRGLHIPAAFPAGNNPEQRPLFRAMWDEMWQGIEVIRSTPIVRGVTSSEAIFQIAPAAMTVAGVVYTQKTLHLGAAADAAFATMTTALAAGAVGGAFIARRIEALLGRPTMMAIGYLGPFFLVTAAASPPMLVIYVAWFCFGFLDGFAVISFQSYLAEAVPTALQGRVYAAWGAIVALASAVAYYGIGLLTPWLGAPAMFGAAGLVVGIGAPVSLFVTGAIRSVRQGNHAAA